ncbi:xanthine dehydrogenase family protein molybdopterin-binding subunit [Psychrobacter aestuarii]|uniref:Xanthine dehydrogenase family protein molybdopterin-binding subunit n=1 Tax=Psychrobacter aestuarii TaxID=556327 RepID=A0ABN0VWB8_9GAMM|nr:xanthine dehydrogenase family protein molybdopterin-binding subunit [Psychrobacter aestuarii]
MALFTSEPTKQMTMDSAVDSLLANTKSKLVGSDVSRVEGALKVSGQARYSAEVQLDNQAYGVLVGATIAKGTVTEIDSSALDDMDGIIKVVTDGERFLRNSQQGTKEVAPTQGAKEVFYHGQPIAVVIAESFEAARAGAHALVVEYKDDSDNAVLDFNNALNDAHDVNEKEGSDKNNEQGDPDKALENAAITIDHIYQTPSQNAAAMEPHATVAVWEGEHLTLYTANQMIASCKKQVADALGMDTKNVQLIARYVGGGFGSKLGIAPELVAAAIAAKEIERPVSIVMTRPQVMSATVRRSNTRQRVAIGANQAGIIDSIIHESTSSNLPDEAFFEPSALSTHYLYRGDNRRVKYQMVDTNQTLSGSMRAPGEAVGQIALECALDELAEKVGIDPIELRRQNEPDEDPSQQVPFSTRKLVECMDTAAKQFGWSERPKKPASRLEGDWWIGMGMAAASRGNSLQPSEARVTLKKDADAKYGVKAVVETDMTDIGTGSYTVFSQVTADMLGLPLEDVEMVLGDSDLPPASGSGGSFGAASAGSSICLACEKLREQLASTVGLYSDTMQLHEGRVQEAGVHAPSVSDALKEAGSKAAAHIKARINEKTGKAAEATQAQYDFDNDNSYTLADILSHYEEQKLVAKGKIKPGKNGDNYRQASFGANFAEVAVHRVTGEVRVRRMTGAFAAGRILNQKTATSQCYGGMVFGIGSALMEKLIFDKRDGRLCNRDLAEYHVPVNADVPQLEVILVEEDDSYTNPMHIKGIGETAISGAAAAIANAVYNAVGIRVYDFPITLDKLLDQLPDEPASA